MYLVSSIKVLYDHMMRQYIFLFCIICGFISCNERPNVTKDGYSRLKITNSSGDDFSYGSEDSLSYFAPYPFNIGIHLKESGQELEMMLISKRVDKGKEVEVLPIAELSYKSSTGVSQKVMIAVPIDKDLKIMDSEAFYEFTVEQFSLKQIVEYWYSNRYGLQGTSIEGWSPASIEDL